MQKQVIAKYAEIEQIRVKKKSLNAYQNSTCKASMLSLPPSEQVRKKFNPIPPEIRGLIAQNVFYEGTMT